MAQPTRTETVTAVVRALALLDAFGIGDTQLTLAELGRRVGLPKPSALRIARTLQAAGYMVQLYNSAWRLGPATVWLGARYQVAFDLHNAAEPVLLALARKTRHTASFFVQDGNQRIRLVRVHGTPDEISGSRIGEQLPLDKGSPGQVILAFAGRRGKLYDEIRARGWHCTIGEARTYSASVAAPVYGAGRRLVGALCVSAAASSMTEARLRTYAPHVVRAANKLSGALSMSGRKERDLIHLAAQTWHRQIPQS